MSNYNETKILEILQRVLGPYQQVKDEYKFHCPFCHHHKPKLQLSVLSQKWHCWVCDSKGRSLYYLLKRLNVSKKILDVLSSLIGKRKDTEYVKSTSDTDPLLLLPREFIPLSIESKNFDYKLAMGYLTRRRISYEDIVKYNIGFCSDGIYSGRIIIPSYDSSGKLNYFIARSYYPHETFKYKNPTVSKNIIVFDLLINWNEPITLCEGVFDGISIKRNAIPLLGKTVPPMLHDKIIANRVKKLYIALDTDARTAALKIADKYMKEGIDVSIINLSQKDPSELGFVEYEKISEKSTSMGFSDLIKEKLYG